MHRVMLIITIISTTPPTSIAIIGTVPIGASSSLNKEPTLATAVVGLVRIFLKMSSPRT